MVSASQERFVRDSLRTLVESLFLTKQIDRRTRLQYERLFRNSRVLRYLAQGLYGPLREAELPGDSETSLVLLSLRRIGKGRFNLLVFRRRQPNGGRGRTRNVRCLVGHRFTREIESRFRWNLRELFGLFGIEETYSGFDGTSVDIIEDLRQGIAEYDFCLFDNRETTTPSKPNVYIEAGMAMALRRPFLFCHYGREVWPSDFQNVFYVGYQSYRELFQKLYAVLPVFLARNVLRQSRTGR